MPLLSNLNSRFLGGFRKWYRAGGAPVPIAAYCPKGAASLAASYVNLANPGTYNAAPGKAPLFDAATGWTFAGGGGASYYLTTGITALGDQTYTLIVRYSDASGTGALIGSRSLTAGNKDIALYLSLGSNGMTSYYGSSANRIPYPIGAVYALAGKQPYRDGATDGAALAADSFINDAELWIGNRSNLAAFVNAKIQAVAIYSSVLTAPQVAAVSAALALI